MKKRKRIFRMFIPFLLTCCLLSCSDDKGKDEPVPVESGEIGLSFSDVPAKVKVGATAEFSVTAVQENRKEAFPLTIDTSGNFSLTVNGISYKSVTSLNPDAENTLKFTPLSAGDNRITFNVTGSDGKKLTESITIVSFLPDVSLSFSSVGDSVSVKEVTEFTFTVTGDEGEEYEVRIDTVLPEFKMRLTDHDGYYTETLLRRGVDLKVNGSFLPDVLMVKSGEENRFTFSDPRCVGDYRLLFSVRDKFGNGKEYEKVIRAYSPDDIVIDFLEVDPWIELGFDKDKYYESLNAHFDYHALPSYFDGKHVDTIYTVEEDMPGHPGETTIPGRGMVVYIGQGEEPELYRVFGNTTENNRHFFSVHWDNDDNSKLQKTGLHALDLNTNSADNNPGTQTYTETIADKWGKMASKTLTIIALPYGSEMPYPDNVWRRRYDWTTHIDPVK